NIDGELTDSIPFDIDIKNALIMKNQAQFHPLKFLGHFVKELKEKGCRIYEQTIATDIDGENAVITGDGHRVQGKHILACSHYPFYGGFGFYFSRMHSSRAYVVAVKTNQEFPG